MQIILGSSSPRRAEILGFFSLPFIQASPDIDEEAVPFTGDPAIYVETLARTKGEALVKDHPEDLILTADTVVYLEGKVYNKPKSRKEASCFLRELSGKEHFVYTAVALSFQNKVHLRTEKTGVTFHELTDIHIEHYLNHVNFLDKAGSYAIQQGGSILVKKLAGCYYNVMGLPLNALQELLRALGIDLWEHMKIL